MDNEYKDKKSFDEGKLKGQDLRDFTFVNNRIIQLKKTREDVFGQNLETIWAEADRKYVPHRLQGTGGKKVIVTDEEKGWRGALVNLQKPDAWRSDIAHTNPFVKIQTAMAILIDRNPEAVFLPASERYEVISELQRQLYRKSWETAKSKQQLRRFVLNLGKYGWACGRTHPLKIERTVKVKQTVDEENPNKSVWETKKVIEYNDVFRENLDPWNTWMDDMARPNNPFSIRDWCWRKVYTMDMAKEEFGNYPNWKYVKPGGTVKDKLQEGPVKKLRAKDRVEIYFYENKIQDLFMVIANGVPLVSEPLPIEDTNGSKKLSLWQTYWLLRHAESPYGIGIFEAIRYDEQLLDRIRNMTIDQLTLSIYKPGFYQGTESLKEEGEIMIKPGVAKQVQNPKDITWMEVKGPGKDAWQGIEMFQRDVDNSSGVTVPLMGSETMGKTAFEAAQAKESALKRLKTPLDNITDALEQEAYLTVALTRMLYSIPEMIKIADPQKIEEYLAAIESDPTLFERDEEDNFTAKVYREVQLGLDTDEKGNLIEDAESRFFRLKPEALRWEGIIKIKGQSILAPSKELTKTMDLEFANLLVPVIQMPPELMAKLAKQLCKIYDKDPKEWLPDQWLGAGPVKEPLLVPQGGGKSGGGDEMPPGVTPTEGGGNMSGGAPIPEPPRAVSSTRIETRPTQQGGGMFNKLMSRVSSAFKK